MLLHAGLNIKFMSQILRVHITQFMCWYKSPTTHVVPSFRVLSQSLNIVVSVTLEKPRTISEKMYIDYVNVVPVLQDRRSSLSRPLFGKRRILIVLLPPLAVITLLATLGICIVYFWRYGISFIFCIVT